MDWTKSYNDTPKFYVFTANHYYDPTKCINIEPVEVPQNSRKTCMPASLAFVSRYLLFRFSE